MSPAPLLFHGSGRLFDGGAIRRPWALLTDERGTITWVGDDPDDAAAGAATRRVDLGAALVTPGLVDSHTHPVFASDRSDELAARHAGEPYDGGGILRTVAATRAASDEQLEQLVVERLSAALRAGTTTVECKSGYGLSTREELRALRVIGRAADRVPVRVIRTLLGAHAVPPDLATSADQARRVAAEMIPAAAAEGLASWVDVFCDRGFFNIDDLERIAGAAAKHGLGLRLHADQLANSGAALAGVRLGAASVDHLEQLDATGVAAIAASRTVATMLPAPAIVLRGALPPARALLDAGATLALASDANAGTFGGWGAMPLVIGLGSSMLGLSDVEALRAATAGGAAALHLDAVGTLTVGAVGDLVAWDATHEGAFWLRLGAVTARRTFVGGIEVIPA